ncbi:MAG: ComF family protein [Thiolinea sp.]
MMHRSTFLLRRPSFSSLLHHGLRRQQCAFCDTRLRPAEHIEPPPIICPDCYHALPWGPEHGPSLGERAAFYYQPPISQWIPAGKSSRHLDKLQLLGELLAERMARQLPRLPQAIVPVPLHPQRLRERGFNQSLELARPLAQRLGIPLLTRQVYRTRHTPDQKQLSAAERTRNLQGVFALTPAATRQLPYQHLAVFDDVITTGTTCASLRELLLQQGTTLVDIWCCATTKQ